MKILTITSHISSNALPCFQRNKTGFGYMVHDIVTSLVSKGNEVDVLVFWYRFKRLQLDGANYLPCSLWIIFLNIFRCLPVRFFGRLLRRYRIPNGHKVRLLYCWTLTGYYRSLIKNGRYDIVHIHGCGIHEDLWIRTCQQLGQRYIVTLHGLNSFNETVSIGESAKRYERDFLHEVIMGKHQITVISTGIKNRILAAENLSESKYIDVVCNSFKFDDAKSVFIDIRKLHNVPDDANVLLYVGNIGRNKNQQQLIEVFPLLQAEIRNNTYVLFIGVDSDEVDMQRLIEVSPCSDHFIYIGGVEKSQISSYYKNATATVLLSFSEGFGLSLLEAMHFGVPCAMFTDMDAYADLYNPCAIVGIPTRRNEDVAHSIEKLLTSKWNKKDIQLHAEKFNSDSMADNYLRVFQSLIEQPST